MSTNPWTYAIPLLDLPEARRSLSREETDLIRSQNLPNAYYDFNTKTLQLDETVFPNGFQRYASIFSLLSALKDDNSRLRQMEAIMWLKSYIQNPQIIAYLKNKSFNEFLSTGVVQYE